MRKFKGFLGFTFLFASTFAHSAPDCRVLIENGKYHEAGTFAMSAIENPMSASREEWFQERWQEGIFYRMQVETPPNVRLMNLDSVTGYVKNTASLSYLLGLEIGGMLQYGNVGADGRRRNDKLNVSGIIVAAEMIGAQSGKWNNERNDIELTIQYKNTFRKVRVLNRWNHGSIDYHAQYFIVDRSEPSDFIIERFVRKEFFTQSFYWFFKGSESPSDFDIAYAAAETYLTLPPGYGVKGVVATLRGKSPNSTGHKNFGIAAGNKRYTKDSLEQLVREIENLMLSLGVISIDRPSADQHWLHHKKTGPLAQAFLKRLESFKP